MALRASCVRRTLFYLNQSIIPLQRETPQVQADICFALFSINLRLWQIDFHSRLLDYSVAVAQAACGRMPFTSEGAVLLIP